MAADTLRHHFDFFLERKCFSLDYSSENRPASRAPKRKRTVAYAFARPQEPTIQKGAVGGVSLASWVEAALRRLRTLTHRKRKVSQPSRGFQT